MQYKEPITLLMFLRGCFNMIKFFIPIITSVSLLALSSSSVFAGKDDNDNNAPQPKVLLKKEKKKQALKVTASFDNKDHLNLRISGHQNKSEASEAKFCQYLQTHKLAHLTSLSVEMETALTPKMVQHMLVYTPKLTSLHLNGFTKVEDSEINLLAKHFPKIVILDETEDCVQCYPVFGEQSKPVAWILLQPVLEPALRKSIANPAYIERSFCMDVHRDDFVSFHDWLNAFRGQFKYPIGLGLSGKGAEGDRIDGRYEVYHEQINVHNYTKKEESAREVNEYKFFGGNIDPRLINERTFYNLMARVGFTEEDFKNGSTGIQGRIAVKPIQLKSKTLAECQKEIEGMLQATMEKSAEAHVTFIFNLPDGAQYKVGDINIRETGITRSHFIGGNNLATIYEHEENRLYFCLLNNQRKTLDLHPFEKDGKFNGITKASAFELVRDFIYERYDAFEDECIVLTGRGNHVNGNGTRGVLVSAFPKWMNDEFIKPFVRKFTPIMGNGGFKILLNKHRTCDLTASNLEKEPLVILATEMNKVIQEGEDRLLVKAKKEHKDILISFLCMNNDLLAFNQEIIIAGSETGIWKLTLRDEDDGSNDEESEEMLPQVQQQPKPAQPQKKVSPVQPKAENPQQKKQTKVGPAKRPAQSAQAKQGPKPAKSQAQQNKDKGKQPGKPANPQGNQQKNKPAPAKQPQAKKPANPAQAKAAAKKGAKKSTSKQNNKKPSARK